MDAIFNATKMDRLIQTNRFLLRQLKDIIKKHPRERDLALELVFDTYVLGDSVMERKYNEA